jgi:hypothetical protein
LYDQEESNVKKKAKETPSVLNDARFQSLFTNPDMQIDVNHDAFKNIAPLMSRLDKQTVVEDESISVGEIETGFSVLLSFDYYRWKTKRKKKKMVKITMI